MSAFKPARRALGSLTLVVLAVTACGRTDFAAQPAAPTLAAQGVRSTFPINSTGPLDFVSPCNGELVAGLSTTTGEGRVLVDGAGGTHVQFTFRTSGTYTGQSTGMTYTESGRGQAHFNLPRSGVVNEVSTLNGQFKASDGSTVLIKERLVIVVGAGGELRVERLPTEANSLSCQ